ncbi:MULTISPECIES: molybdopterin-binding protein [Methanoculleus]|uniref:Molybdenum cofactor synthesis domain n=2 Tax=Methanoculleus TaxID=45989 RepID=A3CUD1_METMJ|nr:MULTISPECIES: molybdopterin-binding protein [Methanoculleus]ABN56981.1 molybdenum cofactor synthesis domain [Methanoculleus marisnigri JR1]UYU18401.1 molybdopterin-binding protein [Methanoculleus submarinus]
MSRRYLNLTPLSEALAIMQREFPSPGRAESVPLAEAVGRVTAEPLYAGYSVPMADIAKFDGYAVKSGATRGAQDQRPLPLAGYTRVNTGEVLPQPFDAVVMIEDTWDEGGTPWIRKSAAFGQHIRRAGEDVRAGELVLPKGHRVRPFDIGALATYGIDRVSVRSVRVGIVPTGSDLVPLGTAPGPGRTIETNTLMAEAYLTGTGATCRRYGIVPDEPDLIREAVETAVAENDLVILSAGSSAGTRDFSRDVVGEIGEIVFHGIAVRPGKPVLLANVGGKPVLGMPGYPVAAQTVLREVAGSLLSWWGLSPVPCGELDVRLARRLASDLGFDEFVPVSVGRVDGTCWATPHPRGGGIQMAVVRANGYLHIPAAREGIEAGEVVRVRLTVPSASLARTLVCVGRRDPVLGELGNRLAESGYQFHCCNASTIGAVLALRANTCHAATVALPETALAWDDQVLRYLPDVDLLRVPVARTELGVASADPLDAGSLASLRVANRPKSAAAQFLLDAWLDREGIDVSPSGVPADVRVCPALEAREAGLRFTPIGCESCDLVIREELAADEGVAALIEAVRSPEFRAYLHSIGRDPGDGDAPGVFSA